MLRLEREPKRNLLLDPSILYVFCSCKSTKGIHNMALEVGKIGRCARGIRDSQKAV